MIEKAINKIKGEMGKNNSYVKVIGEFLLHHLEGNPETAEKILQESKTIIKSLDEVKKVARAKQINGCAMLTDEEVFNVILKYFGIEGTKTNVTPIAPVEKIEVPKAKEIDFDVKLEDFI